MNRNNNKAIFKNKKCIQYVIVHIETVNIKFLNDIIWSIEVGDNLGDMLDTKIKEKGIYEGFH